MLSVKQGGIKYHFWVFGMTWSGIEYHWRTLLTIMPMKKEVKDANTFGIYYNAMPNQMLGVQIPQDNGQDQIVLSGNYYKGGFYKWE